MTTTTYRFTTSADARAVDHANHIWEEWHAYLSADVPEYVSANGSGFCCHDCHLVIVEVF